MLRYLPQRYIAKESGGDTFSHSSALEVLCQMQRAPPVKAAAVKVLLEIGDLKIAVNAYTRQERGKSIAFSRASKRAVQDPENLSSAQVRTDYDSSLVNV